ncbi:hypothetical protein Micbo1qcDRAFT_156236 [Microdochium bolleyi]|uniref:Uncharacterized protein n=1 Tax=Microdochium bolleyi TaxID=196109 RepID=A0A136JJR9_9PEZI|nr:hypothetical protein Micbo1qcDRAFT_156236 [Microdochium bolleyi]
MLRHLTIEAPIALALAVFDNLQRILDISWDTTICDYGRNLEPFVEFTANFKPWVLAQRLQLEARQAISETDEVVKAFSLDQPLVDRIEAALNVLNKSSRSVESSGLWQRATKLSSVQAHFEHLTTKTTQLSSQVKHLVIKLKTGLDFDPFEDLESTRHQEKERQLVLADALRQVTLCDTMSPTQVKNDLVAKLPDAHQARAFQLAGIGAKMSVGNLTRFYGPRQRQLPQNNSRKPDESTLATVEAELNGSLASVKALLYGALCAKRHRLLRWTYSDWNDVPLELLVQLNIQKLPSRSASGPTRVAGTRRASTQSAVAVQRVASHGGREDVILLESKLKPSSRTQPLPEGVEVSPVAPHLRRRWNPPQKRTWLQPEDASSQAWRISAVA